MPLYQYQCDRCFSLFERRASFKDASWPCDRCTSRAKRVEVYREQYISCETGPKTGPKSEPPREEKSYRKEFKEFQEASQEMEHAYRDVEKKPNYYKAGLREAKRRGAKVRA